MADITYTIILKDQGIKAFTMPQGFWPDVEIHCWGAGGGGGRGAVTNTYGGYGVRGLGGGGGYAKTTINIYEGDEVSLQIGQPGTKGGYPQGGLGGVDPTYRLFRGGNSSNAYDEDADTGAGGGGGGASWVAVNGTYVCVGAGGGGAGGLGDDGSGGNPGLPGGVTTNGLAKGTRGGDAPAGWSTGGGGGAGYPKGGAAGTSYGDDAPNPPAGSGGQNYGNVTVAGSGINPGGTTVSYYPGEHRGEAGYPGYIAIILRKKLQVFVKNADGSGNWSNVAAAYTKVPSTIISTIASTSSSTTNYTPNPSNLSGLQTLVNNLVAGGTNTLTGWYTFSPNLIDLANTSGIPVSSIPSELRSTFNNDLYVEIAGNEVYSTSEETRTSITIGSDTYTRGSLAYTGTISLVIPLDGGGNLNWTTTVSMYNFTKITTVTAPTPVATVTGGWKQIQQAFTKVSGSWKPILTNKPIDLYNYPVKRISANISIVADTDDYNLYDNLPVTYFEGLMDIDVWVYPNVVITGNSTSTAFTVSDFTSGDTITLRNYGYLAGRGGDGGGGGYRYTSGKNTYTAPPTAGGAGGTGLLIGYPITLLNFGNIAGGGGGGGGGAVTTSTSGKSTTYNAGGRGGGGAAYGKGYNNGTLTSGGAGENAAGGDGGSGASRGQAGSAGGGGGAAGGRAGYAIQGVTNLISSSNTGAYYGPLA